MNKKLIFLILFALQLFACSPNRNKASVNNNRRSQSNSYGGGRSANGGNTNSNKNGNSGNNNQTTFKITDQTTMDELINSLKKGEIKEITKEMAEEFVKHQKTNNINADQLAQLVDLKTSEEVINILSKKAVITKEADVYQDEYKKINKSIFHLSEEAINNMVINQPDNILSFDIVNSININTNNRAVLATKATYRGINDLDPNILNSFSDDSINKIFNKINDNSIPIMYLTRFLSRGNKDSLINESLKKIKIDDDTDLMLIINTIEKGDNFLINKKIARVLASKIINEVANNSNKYYIAEKSHLSNLNKALNEGGYNDLSIELELDKIIVD